MTARLPLAMIAGTLALTACSNHAPSGDESASPAATPAAATPPPTTPTATTSTVPAPATTSSTPSGQR